MYAVLALKDGTVFEGKGFGAVKDNQKLCLRLGRKASY